MLIEDKFINRETLPYRQGVLGIVLNKHKEVLVVQMVSYGKNDWRFPGGGIDDKETPDQALLRELKEELGSENFSIVAQSKYRNLYEWDEGTIRWSYGKHGRLYRGQEQHIFLVSFGGEYSDIIIDPDELKSFKWIPLGQLPAHLTFPVQMDVIQKVIDELITGLG